MAIDYSVVQTPIGGPFDHGPANDPNVKIGQIYFCHAGYFIVSGVSGGFATICYSGSNEHKIVLRNTFADNIAAEIIKLVEDEVELAKALLSF